ncbi:MAG: hypothetical protein Q8J76_01790 [Desulfobulbaceae bacterium]|nr:hypothetical protein [Desulfobulbaceae bacterium]
MAEALHEALWLQAGLVSDVEVAGVVSFAGQELADEHDFWLLDPL